MEEEFCGLLRTVDSTGRGSLCYNGFRSAVKERLGRSAAEMIYGTTLRLPGEFTKQYTVDANTDLENYSDKLRVAMLRRRLCPPRDTQQHNIFQFKEIATCTHVFLRRIAIAPPLTAPYDNTYIAPHSGAPAVSCANGNGGGLRTYSRIPLHLRGKTSGAADTVIDSNKSNCSNIANRDKILTDTTLRKTRVGRIIQTPARFVQMVHAIVAPNDIYGGPNRMHSINNVFKL